MILRETERIESEYEDRAKFQFDNIYVRKRRRKGKKKREEKTGHVQISSTYLEGVRFSIVESLRQ